MNALTDTSERLVFLLGAGVSKDAGLPLMADLTNSVREALSPPHTDGAHLLLLFQRCVALVSNQQQGYPNIEAVLELLDHVREFKAGPSARAVAQWAPPFDAALEVVEELAARIRSHIRAALARALASADYLFGLLDFHFDLPVDVFTLNYDRLVESMAARFDVPFTTGFGEAWDPGLLDLDRWHLRVHKLHGSVDWYRLRSRNVVYRGSQDHPAFPDEPAQEVLLYPTQGKAAHADPFATLMARFNSALASATVCIAIGYSFRDAHIRRLTALKKPMSP